MNSNSKILPKLPPTPYIVPHWRMPVGKSSLLDSVCSDTITTK